MTSLQRIFVMLWIMAVQTLVIGCMVVKPQLAPLFLSLWAILAGVFWWQFYEAMK